MYKNYHPNFKMSFLQILTLSIPKIDVIFPLLWHVYGTVAQRILAHLNVIHHSTD